MGGRHEFFLFPCPRPMVSRSLAMQISFWALLSVAITAPSDANSKPSGDAAYSILQRGSEDSPFDQSVAQPINDLNPLASSESPTLATSDSDLFAGIPPDSDGSEILSGTSKAVSDGKMFSSASSTPAFETAFAPDKDPESAKPPCTSPTMAACCIENSMFTSCVWWDLDRIFCEDSNNYACCESIQDYIGTNCEQAGQEGKDWDWLEDILRTPIMLEPPIIPPEYLPSIPLLPERV